MGRLFGKRSWIPEPPVPPYPGAPVPGDTGATFARVDQPLAVPTVWACVGLIANTISTFPLETYDPGPGGPTAPKRVRVTDPKVILEPAPQVTQSEWLHMTMVSLLLRGNAYGLVTGRDRNTGLVTGLSMLNPDDVQVKQHRDTGVITYGIGTKARTYSADDVWHVRGMTIPGSAVGLSPISYAALCLDVDLSARRFSRDFFSGATIPKAIVESDQEINMAQANTIKERVMNAMVGREPVVLGAGLKYVPLTVKPEESQFLLTQHADVSQIARYFGVPPEMVGGEGSKGLTYSNVEQRSLDFLTYCIGPWLKRLEDSIFRLIPGKSFVKFDPASLLRLDAETQAAVHIQEVVSRVRAPSEIRAEKNLPPLTPEQLLEMQMVPLEVNVIGGKPPNMNPDDPTSEAADEPKGAGGRAA